MKSLMVIFTVTAAFIITNAYLRRGLWFGLGRIALFPAVCAVVFTEDSLCGIGFCPA